MKTHIIVLSAITALTLGACQSNPKTLPPGEYKSTSSSTNSQGTTTTTDTTTDVGTDAYGNKRAVVQSKTTKDPKGLFNKTTTQDSTQVYQ